ncbi:MAG TPA: hypothetical protein VFN05_06470, partial [Actinomycetes bacterium]|nr:hypothetical protein [Actinomycetes bacterium]
DQVHTEKRRHRTFATPTTPSAARRVPDPPSRGTRRDDGPSRGTRRDDAPSRDAPAEGSKSATQLSLALG